MDSRLNPEEQYDGYDGAAFLGERGANIEEWIRIYDHKSDHEDFTEIFSANFFIAGSAWSACPLIHIWGDVDRAEAALDWHVVHLQEATRKKAVQLSFGPLLCVSMLNVWGGFIVAGKSAQGFNVLHDMCSSYDKIESWYRENAKGLNIFGDKDKGDGEALFNLATCILHVKAVWLLMCPTGDIDPDKVFKEFNFSAQEYGEMNLMNGQPHSQVFFMGCIMPVR